MNLPPDDRLQRQLGGAHLARLRKRLRQRFEHAALEGILDSFRIGGLAPVEHAALAALQGSPPRFSSSIQVDVARIDAALIGVGLADSLRDLLERLDGPIAHVPSERDRTAVLWTEAVASCTHGALATLVQTPAGIGLLRRLSNRDPQKAAELLRLTTAVLQHLPAHGLTRARLAAEVLGNAHALDSGQPMATLVLAVWRQSLPTASPQRDELELRGNNTRDIWAKAGVLVNELARPALFLNLPVQGPAAHRYCLGEPDYLSLRALLRSPRCWDVGGRDVFVCENPNLLAIAADCLGVRCAPLVCTDGMPAAAQQELLAQLMQAGARLHYHGDFDWAGVRIGNYVVREYGARPWRFGATDYVDAVQAAPALELRLEGPEANASWDEALAPAMRNHRLPIPEEGVARKLLPDLEI
jgi:uncharacterized protein (TIGR02679 family)